LLNPTRAAIWVALVFANLKSLRSNAGARTNGAFPAAGAVSKGRKENASNSLRRVSQKDLEREREQKQGNSLSGIRSACDKSEESKRICALNFAE
jgi:hypothetical protein